MGEVEDDGLSATSVDALGLLDRWSSQFSLSRPVLTPRALVRLKHHFVRGSALDAQQETGPRDYL